MKILKIIGILILTVIGLLIVWVNLPTSILYYSEIKYGNEFVENIYNYKKQHGQFPKDNSWDTLKILNPLKPYETFYPEYHIIDKDNFSLTYIEGFDPPYLQYDTKSKKWEKK
ncbi:MAG: hypothetical protein Q8928_05595 [Bacteroidota bacterium]|nr:hypothetical protein [Bacteroidota bacterium]